MPLTAGEVIFGRYRIIRLLGQGGFGAVYQAWDQNLDRVCALKANLETTEDVARQFEREAILLANLNHPNLPRVTDHFRIPNQGQYLVMDYIEGEDLQQRLDRAGGPLPSSEVVAWGIQVCDALAYLHQHNPPIIHRDVKPANIRINSQNQAMLVDFGIAKAYTPSARTTVGARAVTPGFSPPEQYGRGETDARSDVYALGATLYALHTGGAPPDSVDIMSGSVEPLLDLKGLNAHVPPGVSAAIMRAMQPAKTARWQSAAAFRQALRQAQTGGDEQARPEGPTGAAVGRAARSAAAPAAGGSGPAAGRGSKDRIIRAPASRPRRRYLPGLLVGGGLGLLLAIAAVALMGMGAWLRSRSGAVLPAATPALESEPAAGPTASEQGAVTDEPAASNPTPLPGAAAPPGAVQVAFSAARLAFVSNHIGQKDRIYVQEVKPGRYWLDQSSQKFLPVEGLDNQPFSPLQSLELGDGHDVAWWPEWCAQDERILYEAQDTTRPDFQTVYSLAYPPQGQPAQPISPPGYSKLGVPRCSHLGQTVLVSGQQTNKTSWGLYSFDLRTPNQVNTVYNQDLIVGNAAWSGDDRYVAFMRRAANENEFSLALWTWNATRNLFPIARPEGIVDAKYPAISPRSGEIAFACSDGRQWNLCLADADGTNVRQVILKISLGSGRPRPIPPVTPSWSPDGAWLALAWNQADNWDVWLFAPDKAIWINMTQGLGQDQYQPAWSKK